MSDLVQEASQAARSFARQTRDADIALVVLDLATMRVEERDGRLAIMGAMHSILRGPHAAFRAIDANANPEKARRWTCFYARMMAASAAALNELASSGSA